MADHEQAVRDAAVALETAVTEAQAAGVRVDLPMQATDIDKVSVSETSKLPPRPPLTKPPVSTLAAPLPDEH